VSNLNSSQRAAVHYLDSPLLVLAGAGSGKTRVITRKIAYLIQESGLAPEHVAAVTFTNKAAREMRERAGRLLGREGAQGLRVSTFHTLGLNILRRDYRRLGYRPGFTIFDAQDSATLLRELTRSGKADRDAEDRLRWQISRWKNALVSPEEAAAQAAGGPDMVAAEAYARYNHYLKTYNALDFDDLIYQPVRLFRDQPAAVEAWRERIRYLLVDEYQDTNACQYALVELLVGGRRGLTVVGDDDQSIYAWRGAQPENLHLLARDFPDLKVIKLEQNYRSAGRILKAANALIANNNHIYEKRLWSALGPGEPLRVLTCRDGDHEADRVAARLSAHRLRGNGSWRDYAILYRGNHQARVFERALREQNIPYHISGGMSFFERGEVKDVMAYLRLLVNPADDAAFLRVVNTPRRGVGAGSLGKLTEFAAAQGASLLTACGLNGLESTLGARAAAPLTRLGHWLGGLAERAEREPVAVARELVKDMDYAGWLRDQSADRATAERRMENVEDLLDWLQRMAANRDAATLADLLAQLTLMDRLEREDEPSGDAVQLMTLHSAKGLEFDHVFLVGMEEELLPHRNSAEDGLEEERRLAYVGLTRGRKSLTLTLAARRKRFGEMIACEPSRFLAELPEEDLIWEDNAPVDPEERRESGKAHLAGLRGLLAAKE